MRTTTRAQASAVGSASYPIVLDGASLDALVVGGGDVAARRTAALLESGASVRVIATRIGARVRAQAGHDRLVLVERPLDVDAIDREIGDALLVIAATDSAELNARIAATARRLRRLVNVVDAPEAGNCITPASHRDGALTIAVSAGGVPTAAARIRDAIGVRFDGRYAAALERLAALRARLLASGAREEWRAASDALIGPDFCESVEAGTFDERVAQWR